MSAREQGENASVPAKVVAAIFMVVGILGTLVLAATILGTFAAVVVRAFIVALAWLS